MTKAEKEKEIRADTGARSNWKPADHGKHNDMADALRKAYIALLGCGNALEDRTVTRVEAINYADKEAEKARKVLVRYGVIAPHPRDKVK